MGVNHVRGGGNFGGLGVNPGTVFERGLVKGEGF